MARRNISALSWLAELTVSVVVLIVPSSSISIVNRSICMDLPSPKHGSLAAAGLVHAPLQLPAELAGLALNGLLGVRSLDFVDVPLAVKLQPPSLRVIGTSAEVAGGVRPPKNELVSERHCLETKALERQREQACIGTIGKELNF